MARSHLRLFVVLLGLLALAGPAQAAPGGVPEVSRAVRSDVSPPLRSMHPLPPHRGGGPFEVRRRSNSPFQGPPLAADPVQQLAAPAAPAAATLTNWDGVNNIDSVVPPDTNGDVGLNDYVQWVNLSFRIWSKTGTSRYGPAAGNTLWQGFGGVCETTNEGDPIVLYDRAANRWMFSQFAFALKGGNPKAPFYQCIAVSQTGDPTGAYYRYAFQVNASTGWFPDYPKFGVWPDGYYMSTNNFSGRFFAGAGAYAFDRAKMLVGDPSATMISFTLSTLYAGILPSHQIGPNAPPAGAPNYFGGVDTASGTGTGSTFQLWKFHADFTTPASSTFTGPTNVAVAPYTFSFCGVTYSSSCIEQPGTTMDLDPLSDRLMNRLDYRRFNDHETLLAAHTVNVGSDRAGMRWYELRSPATTPTLFQQGTFAPSDGVSRWMGSVAMDGAGNIALGYSASDNGSVFPSVRYTGRLAGDPAGTMTVAETSIIAGGGSQTGYSRWGDYSSMSIDPSDDQRFWYTQEYYSSTSALGWRTRIASFTLGSGDTTPPDTTIDSGPSGLTNNASPSFTFSSSEAGSTFECKLDGPGATTGTFASCTSPKNYSGLADGAYTFSVRATDTSSNTDLTPATRTFTVDATPPNTLIDSGPTGTVSVTSASFTFHSTEGGSTFACKLDGPGSTTGSYAACTSPKGYSGLANGSYTFSVRATDAATNTDPSAATQSWTVANYRNTILGTAGVSAYWKLGESAGPAAADELGSNDGTYVNGVALEAPGAVVGDSDTAAALDGTNDYVQTPVAPTGTQGTIEFWAYAADLDNRNAVVYTADNGVTTYTHQVGVTPDGRAKAYIYDGTRRTITSAPSAVAATEWHYYALTWQDTVGASLYVDGQLAGQTPLGSAWKSGNKLLFGQRGGAGLTANWRGRIDEPAYYTTALSGSTISGHYRAGTPLDPPRGLVATGADGQVSLDWPDDSVPGFAGYDVLRSTTKGGPYTKINASPVASSDYVDTGVTNTVTYYYVVRVLDTAGAVSQYSNEASATPGYRATITNTSGLTAYWRLGETTGTNAVDELGVRDGTYVNGVTLGAAGAIAGDTDTAASFDGVDDFVQTPVVLNGSQGTIEFWAYAGDLNSRNAVVYTADDGATTFSHAVGVRTDGSVKAYLWDGARRTITTAAGLITPGTWHYYALVWQDGVGASLYVDGALAGTTALASAWKPGNKVLFGQRAGTASGLTNRWLGRLDEPAIYGAALSGAAIAAHYAAG